MQTLLKRLTIPAVIAQLITFLYNIVDRMFVAKIEGFGMDALAALGIVLPITLIIQSLTICREKAKETMLISTPVTPSSTNEVLKILLASELSPGKILPLIFRLTIPAVIAQLITFLYNIVDQI